MENPFTVKVTDEEVYIYHKGNEVIMWNMSEVEEEPSALCLLIADSIHTALTNPEEYIQRVINSGKLISVGDNLVPALDYFGIEPKPCPFCKEDWAKVETQEGDKGNTYLVGCPVCCAAGPVAFSKAEAISKWNNS